MRQIWFYSITSAPSEHARCSGARPLICVIPSSETQATVRLTMDVEIRRIFLREDTDQIKKMQLDAPEFLEHYPEHRRWLDMALVEVLHGRRVAFGLYRSVIDARRQLQFELVGSTILKLNYFTRTVDLKNLYVCDEVRSHGYGRALLKKTHDYCTKAGFASVATEVPAGARATVGFLHDLGYSITNTYQSRYKPGDTVYRMSISLPPRYVGDIFDFAAFALWLLEHGFGFRHVSQGAKANSFRFSVPQLHHVSAAASLRGQAYIKDGPALAAEIESVFCDTEDDLALALCREFSPDAIAACKNARIRHFDWKLLKAEYRDFFAHKLLPFSREDIRGFALNLHQQLFARVRDATGGFVLFKNGPTGKYLRPGNQLLLISEPSVDHPLGGVEGIANIAEAVVDRPIKVWQYFEAHNPIFHRTEYDAYAREQGDLLGLRVDSFRAINHVDYFVLLHDIIQDNVELPELGCCYLSKDMLDRFEKFEGSRLLADSVKGRKSLGKNELDSHSGGRDTMRILFLSANPSQTSPLDLEEELRSLEQELRGVQFRDSITLIARHTVRPDDLIRHVRTDKPDVIHFSGHGSTSGIILRNDAGGYQSVEGANLKQFLEGRGISLIVLNACYSKGQADTIQGAVKTVVGTTDAVGDEAARRFTVAFYRSLGNGLSVREAFRDGRDAVALHNLVDVYHSEGDLDLVMVKEAK